MNNQLQLFYYNIRHKLWLCQHLFLDCDCQNIIKRWLYQFEKVRIIQPPPLNLLNTDQYIDRQGIVFNVKPSFEMTLDYDHKPCDIRTDISDSEIQYKYRYYKNNYDASTCYIIANVNFSLSCIDVKEVDWYYKKKYQSKCLNCSVKCKPNKIIHLLQPKKFMVHNTTFCNSI